ncbi:hypothetical protein VB834_16035 [Limnoraphis robusta Tam1]|uniref:Uncharacterized protein n=1 Tax=Limnoraphis robusta CCNP1315 TaxID=3110306 RepID=A0ABU5U4F3_9CYAN|nr:hypothetical protein [Limnoraphis robusta]MEA5501026.1 hypothetical protein [Limnoraphis robusta BA-68 BA1]MEA5522004.1 hypothetical protein [Limnoraphis robusta CCNP1315]MEA5540536.1 hypothetical protein [Limnoraphis robusta Tam1]MEA5545247.1 hypothetical protein [Limnoraphis robusta CCNP1324]
METSFLTAVLPNDLQTAEPVDVLTPNSLIENLRGTMNLIMDSLHQSIGNMMEEVSHILDEGLNENTDSIIDQLIGEIDPIINQTVDQVNHLINSQFQMNPEGVFDPVTGERIIPPNLVGDATVITPINQPALEMIVSDPMAIDTSLIFTDPMMAMSNLVLEGTVSIPTVMGTSNRLLEGTVNNPMIATSDPLVNGIVSDSSFSLF